MGALEVLFGLHATVLPFAVVAAWMVLALTDLVRREDLGRGARVVWVVAVMVVPAIGAAAALLASPSLPRWAAAAVLGGGIAAVAAVVVVTGALGAFG